MIDKAHQKTTDKQKAYWRKNVATIRNLLIIWVLVSHIAAILLAKPLSNIDFFGLNLAFWFAQQGSIVIFVGLIFYYAWRMDRLDKKYDVQEIRLTSNKKSNKGASV